MNEQILNRIANALEKIARIGTRNILKDLSEQDQTERVKILKSLGYESSETAELLGITENAVNVAFHRAKKKNGKRKSK